MAKNGTISAGGEGYMTFSERLMQLRKQRGWSQEQLGEQLHVTRQTVSKWETGVSQS